MQLQMVRPLFAYFVSTTRGHRLIAVASCVSTIAILVLAGVPQTMLTSFETVLEEQFIPADLPPDSSVSGIIALGGGIERTREAVKISSRFPGARLVITGATDADYDLARGASVGLSRVIVEPNAKTTFENAKFTRRLVAPQPGERWLLVTSAAHMPRAIATFAAAGFAVEPWPVYDLPTTSDAAAHVATHELLGLIGYRIMGRTAQLWPSRKASNPGHSVVPTVNTPPLDARRA